MLKKLLPLALASLFVATVNADEADIKKAMEAKLGAKVESVTKSGYLGLYEVYSEGNILYTDDKMTAFIAGGQLIDGKTMKNVTEERMRKLTAIKFSELPLDRAIKQVRGDGKRVLATFEDPNCGYCKRLAKDLLKLDNVTIYTFLYPILSEDSIRKSKQIWCSVDRAKAWNDWMVEGRAPSGKDDCDTAAITKNQEYGRRLGISGTPTMFFADGERVPGAMPLAKIEQKLGQLK
ncbi:MAG TPA: DsbC family protein [Azonexus sp.]|jgi:thiol:disulfide interchange protein DsbC|nr:DsbC family protein [Azonexus sp.]